MIAGTQGHGVVFSVAGAKMEFSTAISSRHSPVTKTRRARNRWVRGWAQSSTNCFPVSEIRVIRGFNALTLGDATRRKTGSFVLNMNPAIMLGGTYVNVSVGGTAIPGADYVPLVSPAYIGQSGYGVILV